MSTGLLLTQNNLGHEIQTSLNEHSPITPFALNVTSDFGSERELLLDVVLEDTLAEASPRVVITDEDGYDIFDLAVNTLSGNFTITNSFMVRPPPRSKSTLSVQNILLQGWLRLLRFGPWGWRPDSD